MLLGYNSVCASIIDGYSWVLLDSCFKKNRWSWQSLASSLNWFFWLLFNELEIGVMFLSLKVVLQFAIRKPLVRNWITNFIQKYYITEIFNTYSSSVEVSVMYGIGTGYIHPNFGKRTITFYPAGWKSLVWPGAFYYLNFFVINIIILPFIRDVAISLSLIFPPWYIVSSDSSQICGNALYLAMN